MSRVDVIIPRTFRPESDSDHFDTLKNRCYTKASSLALLYFIQNGEVDRSIALLSRLHDNLFNSYSAPDYLDQSNLDIDVNEGSRASDLWLLYTTLVFINSLGPSQPITLRYIPWINNKLSDLQDLMAQNNDVVVEKGSVAAYVENQSLAYYIFSSAHEFFQEASYESAKNSVGNAVLNFYNNGDVASFRDDSLYYDFRKLNSEAYIFSAMVLFDSNNPLYVNVLQKIQDHFVTIVATGTGLSYLVNTPGKIRYDITALYARLLNKVEQFGSSLPYIRTLENVSDFYGAVLHASYEDMQDTYDSTSPITFASYTFPSIYSTALKSLVTADEPILFTTDTPSIYNFSIFEESVDSSSFPELLLNSSVDSAENNTQNILQDV